MKTAIALLTKRLDEFREEESEIVKDYIKIEQLRGKTAQEKATLKSFDRRLKDLRLLSRELFYLRSVFYEHDERDQAKNSTSD